MAKKILFVEDDEDIQTITQLALENVGGFMVKICSSGEETLSEVGLFKPEIILLDVMMPGMDGLHTLQKLRQHAGLAAIPVVFMTARVQADDIRHYRDLGAVDVIAKPFEPMALPGKVQTILDNLQAEKEIKQKQLTEQFGSLRKNYARELPAKINALKKDWQSFKNQPTLSALKDFIRRVHSLSGSGAIFNFPAVSEAARLLETKLRDLNIDMEANQPYANPSIDELVNALESAALTTFDEDDGTASALARIKASSRMTRKMLLICDNNGVASNLYNQLGHFDLRAKLIEFCQDLQQTIEDNEADDIYIIQGDHQKWPDCISGLAQFKYQPEYRFIIAAVSEDDSFAGRLDAVRAGADAYFLRPVKITELVNYIRSQLLTENEQAYRILIVEDDLDQAHFTAFIMEQAGMETCIIPDPAAIMEALNGFYPELVLMDLYMPGCSGLELAAVIRQYPEYAGISIVFLSTDSDIDRHNQALLAGGDEFIVKSLSPERLLVKVEAKVKRARLIQSLMLRDSLTGLLNRSSIDDYLLREINKIKRQAGVFSYVMLDLDHFKQVNDRYGHAAGDDVLKSLALLLRQRLRTTDLAGRYGGEEFAIILPDASAGQAKRLLEELLQIFRKIKFTNGEEDFFATFSAGIAEYPDYSEAAPLVEAADHALYQAKAEGRNRVCIAPGINPAVDFSHSNIGFSAGITSLI